MADLEGMTKDELIAEAEKVGADFKPSMKKDDIAKAIVAASEADRDRDLKDGDGEVPRTVEGDPGPSFGDEAEEAPDPDDYDDQARVVEGDPGDPDGNQDPGVDDSEPPRAIEGDPGTPEEDEVLRAARERAREAGVVVPDGWTVQQIDEALSYDEGDDEGEGVDGHDGYRPNSPRG